SDHWLDVAAFDQTATACQTHAHRRLERCPACLRRLAEAIQWYQGDFLAGFALPSDLFEQWVVTERERLHRQALDILHALAAYHERRGEHALALGYARRQIALESWQEEAHRQAMRALAAQGQREAALKQYEACRQTLAQELSVEPEAETTRLYEQIRTTDASSLIPSPSHHLPAPLTPFVGREAELAQIETCLQDPACRLLTLVGLGGIGKTRLALEAATEQAWSFERGAFWVSLIGVQGIEGIVPAIAQGIGFSFFGRGEPQQQLTDYLRNKEMLLVLDNVEHLLAGMNIVADLLRAAPDVKMLVTSRARLNMRCETVLAVDGMEYPDERHVAEDDLRQYSSVILFMHEARRVCPGFALTDETLPHVAHICRLAQGMPLAILLAAAWAAALTPAQIAAEVEKSLDFLQVGWKDETRHGSMRAVFDSAWRMLSQDEQAALARLSVFRGGWTLAAAEQAAGADLVMLNGLAAKSLVQWLPTSALPRKAGEVTPAAGGGGRYEMHELLRQYAEEKLKESGEEAWARDQHGAFYMARLRQWSADWRSIRQRQAAEEMTVEIDNAHAAWDWTARQGFVTQLDGAMVALKRFYDHWNRGQEAERAFQLAAGCLWAMVDEPSVAPQTIKTLIKLLVQLSTLNVLFDQEKVERLRRQCQALLARPELASQDVRFEQTLVLLMPPVLGGPRLFERDPHLLEECLARFRKLGDRWWEGFVLGGLGVWESALGNRESSQHYLEESMSIFQSLGDREMAFGLSYWLSINALGRGDAAETERLGRLALQIGKDLYGQYGTGYGQWILSFALPLSGRYAEARAAEEMHLAIWQALGIPDTDVFRSNLGWILTGLGQYEQARFQVQKSLDFCRSIGDVHAPPRILWYLAKIVFVQGDVALADQLARQSLDEYKKGTSPEISLPWTLRGYTACRMGQYAQAAEFIARGLRISMEQGYFGAQFYAPPAAALLALEKGHIERAVELYALALCHPYIANSRWFEDVAGQRIAAAAMALPPQVREAAEARGRARDWHITMRELLDELEQMQVTPQA
ncbi:MAG: hypothetical protein JW934_18225, partial [Anaerolineae bacterium]|nr:hypothetical protein [Anaerolineae bacterium]